MLHRIGYQNQPVRLESEGEHRASSIEEEKDMIKAIELLYEFKKGLSKLNPICTEAMTRIISERHF